MATPLTEFKHRFPLFLACSISISTSILFFLAQKATRRCGHDGDANEQGATWFDSARVESAQLKLSSA